MDAVKIAVLMTSYNRRETTLSCLEKVYLQELEDSHIFAVYLVDDNSTDGTFNSVQAQFPQVKVIKGNGNLYWCGGMRLAFATAAEMGYDYYLWLNDDTFLNRDCLKVLLQAHEDLSSKGYEKTLIIGSTYDPVTGEFSYGGVKRKRFLPFKFTNVNPEEKAIQCDTGNGNCVLIPHPVYEIVGNIDAEFTHVWGDFDYGLRASKMGCTVWSAPGYVGSCSSNPLRKWKDYSLTYSDRLGYLSHPKELYYLKERKIYMKRHMGALWFLLYLSPLYHLTAYSITAYFANLFRIRPVKKQPDKEK